MSASDLLMAAAGVGGATPIDPYFIGNTDTTYLLAMNYATETNLYVVVRNSTNSFYIDCIDIATGSLVWRTSTTYSAAPYAVLAIHVNASGEVYVAWSYNMTISTTYSGTVVKLNADGTQAWKYALTRLASTVIRTIKEVNGYLYICGAQTRSGSASDANPFLVKIQLSTQTVVWSTQLQFTGLLSFYGNAYDFAFDGAGGIFLVGSATNARPFVSYINDSTGVINAVNVFSTPSNDLGINSVYYDSGNSRAVCVGTYSMVTADTACNVTGQTLITSPWVTYAATNNASTPFVADGKAYVLYRLQALNNVTYAAMVIAYNINTFAVEGNVVINGPSPNSSIVQNLSVLSDRLTVGFPLTNVSDTGTSTTTAYTATAVLPLDISSANNITGIYSSATASVSGIFLTQQPSANLPASSVTVTVDAAASVTPVTTAYSWSTTASTVTTTGLTSSTYFLVDSTDKVNFGTSSSLIDFGVVKINSATGATLTYNLPDNIAENDVVIVATAKGALVSWTPTPATYTLAASITSSDSYTSSAFLHYKVMGATPDTTVALPSSGGTAYSGVSCIFVLRGLDTANIFDTSATTAALQNGFLITPASITPATSNCVVVCISNGQSATTTGYATNSAAGRAKSNPPVKGGVYWSEPLLNVETYSGSGTVVYPARTYTNATSTTYSAVAITFAIRTQ